MIIVVAVVAAIIGYSAIFTVYEGRQALVVRLGDPIRVVNNPGLHFKAPFIDTVIYVDKRILDLENPQQEKEIIASDQKRLVVDAFARYRIVDPLRFYQATQGGSITRANQQLSTLLNSALRRVLGEASFQDVVRDERAVLMGRIRSNSTAKPNVTASTSSMSASAAPICPIRTARRCISACRPSGNARPLNSAPRVRSARRKSARAPIAT